MDTMDTMDTFWIISVDLSDTPLKFENEKQRPAFCPNNSLFGAVARVIWAKSGLCFSFSNLSWGVRQVYRDYQKSIHSIHSIHSVYFSVLKQ